MHYANCFMVNICLLDMRMNMFYTFAHINLC
jgi:hypothetical protein